MRHSPEALTAFAEAASLGSFSAASRKLGKSQSTISSAIANLEVDLGLRVFDRSSRKPTLTPQDRVVLLQVQGILETSDRLDRCASQLSGGLEARLGVVWSVTYQSDSSDDLLIAFEQRFPDLAFESLIAEHEDLVSLVQTGRADIGVVAAQASYPPPTLVLRPWPSSLKLRFIQPHRTRCHCNATSRPAFWLVTVSSGSRPTCRGVAERTATCRLTHRRCRDVCGRRPVI